MAFGRSTSFIVLYNVYMTHETCHSTTEERKKKKKRSNKNIHRIQQMKKAVIVVNEPAQMAMKIHATIKVTASEPVGSC